jgi:hypothetical protein
VGSDDSRSELRRLGERDAALRAELRTYAEAGYTSTWIAGALTVGGVAAAWATFGVSLAVSIGGAIWFAKETVETRKIKHRMRDIMDELDDIERRQRALRGP